MEAVRQIHDDPGSRPEEAAIEAVRRMIVGASADAAGAGRASAGPAPVKKPKKKHKSK